MWYSGKKDSGKKILRNKTEIRPSQSFYSLSIMLTNSRELRFDSLKGKKVLLVNTASDCGYTSQYGDLQKLFDTYNDSLTIIAFPANDFKEQEKGNDAEIAQFCQVNFGVTFPLAKKSAVVGENRNAVFKWLSDKNKNGWNSKQPSWNFSKYLVSEQGVLTHYFGPAISPMGKEVTDAIKY